MSISAVVPVWNGRELLARLLDSLEKQTVRPAEILVVDNGSADGAPELARSRGARVIGMGHNAGFAAAVNRGIREAQGERIAVLNSDVELSADYLASLSEALDAAGAWFATGKVLSAGDPRLIDGTFDALCRGGVAWRVGHGCPDGPAFSVAQSIYSAPWTAALFRAELFSRTGLLEERFESYYEDVDFGLRCAALGLEGRYVPQAVAWHRGSAALGRWHPEVVRRIARNQVYLVARHYPHRLRWRWMRALLVAQLLWGAVALRHGKGWAWLRGKWEGWRRRRSFSAALHPAASDHSPGWEEVLGVLCEAGERRMRGAPGIYWRLYFLLTGGGAK
jgi:GT2 family glycosyltransferase